jgi:hypothetical protein
MPLTNPWLSGPTPTKRLDREGLEERILNLLSSQNMCVLATVGPDGPLATPVLLLARLRGAVHCRPAHTPRRTPRHRSAPATDRPWLPILPTNPCRQSWHFRAPAARRLRRVPGGLRHLADTAGSSQTLHALISADPVVQVEDQSATRGMSG